MLDMSMIGRAGAYFVLQLMKERDSMDKPTEEQLQALLVRCLHCYINKVETRYPKGRDCPRCGKSNDKAC